MAACRITAACAIVNASAASPKHQEISRRQKQALLAVIKKESLPVEDIASTVSELSQAKWCAEDLQDVIDALQDTINEGEQSDDLNDNPLQSQRKEPLRQVCTLCTLCLSLHRSDLPIAD